MLKQRLSIILVSVISLSLLVPGLILPMMTLKADLNRQSLVSEGQKIITEQNLHPAMASMANQFLGSLKVDGHSRIYEKKRSILGTAEDLWNFGYKLVAVLIITFSVVIPALKTLLLLSASIKTQNLRLLRLSAAFSKWSMADVFAIGVLIACLSANASSSESAIVNFQAELHQGFYWFVAYCLLSGVMGQWLTSQFKNSE